MFQVSVDGGQEQGEVSRLVAHGGALHRSSLVDHGNEFEFYSAVNEKALSRAATRMPTL